MFGSVAKDGSYHSKCVLIVGIQVAKIDFPYDKIKDQRRAFCFVEFESDKAVKKVLDQATHKLGGQEVSNCV